MKSFDYGDKMIGSKEMAVAVASMILGGGIITLPRVLAGKTFGADGWLSILIAGIFVCLFTHIAVKLAIRFPHQSFFQYTSSIVSKPIAYALVFVFGVYAMSIVAFEIRLMGNIAKLYLFSRTPTEVLTLSFLLVIAYAVAGTRAAIFRLNLMFFPIVMIVAAVVVVMNLGAFDFKNLFPIFTTDWKGLYSGVKETAYKMLGFEIVLFYIMYMTRPQQAYKASRIGVGLVVMLYILIYITCIGVFANEVTQTIVYPAVELARQVEVPGEFFERFESIFFTVWIMTIFNTSAMAYDIALISVRSMFKQGGKLVYLSFMSPIIYLMAMYPPTHVDVIRYGRYISYTGLTLGAALPALLLLIAVLRGVKGDG
ncbi:spore gernimation protein [Ammoniphilus oxalaticus]|uniref:Spore gernimation protein n=1 Tax=Ammoniphilus oxalaticus TaxID=66863 RepID=A0A419SD52_9BACL|nr:endospore germination permease [Ammoniphilus oxalaticus]RKD21028.1 spore gernimation protein [Ammoniphilus oxalaticus]